MGDVGRAVRLAVRVRGYVQGVGFRLWVRDRAREFGLVGRATNLPDGQVEVIAEGSEPACQELLAALRGPRTPGRVSGVIEGWDAARGDLAGFELR